MASRSQSEMCCVDRHIHSPRAAECACEHNHIVLGVGARWSAVASCGAVSGIWPIPLRFPAGHPFWPPIPKALYGRWWVLTHKNDSPTCVWGWRNRPMGWGGGWGRGGVRWPHVTQFRVFGPFPLRFTAGHPFLPPIPKALYTRWWVLAHKSGSPTCVWG